MDPLAFLFVGLTVSMIDPVWATPINTALLVVMVLLGRRTHQAVQEVHTTASHAASAAAAAAAAAADSARITKELGAAARHTDLPAPNHT